MKKILSILLSVTTISFCLVGCGEPKSSPVEDFKYEFKDGEVTIIGYTGTDLEIIVPDTIEDRPVVYIGYDEEEGKGAFEGYDMTSIVIPEGVKLIHELAFKDCKMLENISLPDSLQGFYYNSSYAPENVHWALPDTKWYQNQPDGVLYIDNVLLGVKEETDDFDASEIEIRDGTTSILSTAFKGEDSLISVTIPDSVKYIGALAFYECDLLQELTVPDGVTVGKDFFEGTINGNVIYETSSEE